MSSVRIMLKRARKKKVMAVTFMFWDMNVFPVPHGFDSHLVRHCIKRLLESYNYKGDLRIAAFGDLSDVPEGILRGVYHSGIDITHVPKGQMAMVDLIESVIGHGLPYRAILVALCNKSRVGSCYNDYKLHYPFACGDDFQTFLLEVIAHQPIECRNCDDSAYWDCLSCSRDPPAHGFGDFIAHLVSEEHKELETLRSLPKPPPRPLSRPPVTCHPSEPTTEIVDKAVTAVFWDIVNSPIPPGFDPRLAGTYIRHYLKNEGFTGPVTITAVGLLSAVPGDVLRGLFSSGVRLTHVLDSRKTIPNRIFFDFTLGHPDPANIFVIAKPNSIYYSPEWRYYYAHQSSDEIFVGGLVEDKSVEWVCTICSPDQNVFQDFEKFTKHLSGIAHERKMLDTCGEWVCTTCSSPDLVSKGFANFTKHLFGRAHNRRMLDFVPLRVRLSKRQPLNASPYTMVLSQSQRGREEEEEEELIGPVC